jgi:hypothetical protein
MLWTVILGKDMWKCLDVRMRGVFVSVAGLIAGWKARSSGLNDIDVEGAKGSASFIGMDRAARSLRGVNYERFQLLQFNDVSHLICQMADDAMPSSAFQLVVEGGVILLAKTKASICRAETPMLSLQTR